MDQIVVDDFQIVGLESGVGPAQIEIDSLDLVRFAAIRAVDVFRSGELDRESLRRRAAHAGPIADDTELYRVEFHIVEG